MRTRSGLHAAILCGTLCFAQGADAARAEGVLERLSPSDDASSSPDQMSSRQYWSSGKLRLFAAAVVDVGTSVRPRLLLGYGRPHWTWGGIELEAATTTSAGIAAVRARIALVAADLSVGLRRTWSYRRTWLTPASSYTDTDLEGSPKARYRSLDLVAWGLVPVGPGFAQWEVEAVRLYGIPRGVDVYEEWLRAAVRAPWTSATRLAYAYTFFHERAAVGAMVEWLWLGRGSLYRAGPLVSYTFTPHWQASILLTTPVQGPDDLSFFTGLYGTARVRWQFATGERTIFD